jgi:multidrug efflux system outer membrane protein
MRRLACALAALTILSGCASEPYERPASPAPAQWPTGAAYPPAVAGVAGLPWRQVMSDERLRAVIERALANNRDLRATVASVARARAQYRAQRSEQLPTVDAGASASRSHQQGAENSESLSADIGISAFELDLFGRLRAQTRSQFETYLSTQSGMRAARLSLVAETANTYLTFAADSDLLAAAKDTQANAERSLRLTQSLHASGLTSGIDVAEAESIVAQAQSDVAATTTQVAQDRNALELLAGAPVEDALLPASLAELDGAIAVAPAGISSEILLQRPDVLEAEHALKATYDDVSAARAAFFPRITLTTALGLASASLTELSRQAWSVAVDGTMPLIGGATGANVADARAHRNQATADYEKAIQAAFRDVADALARRGTITAQRDAQTRLLAASARSADLADRRYRAGLAAYLDVLTAQRTLYSSRQTAISTTLADLSNRINLYAAIGADASLQ